MNLGDVAGIGRIDEGPDRYGDIAGTDLLPGQGRRPPP